MSEEQLKLLSLDDLIHLMMKEIKELQTLHRSEKETDEIDEKRKQVELLHKIIAEKKGDIKPDFFK